MNMADGFLMVQAIGKYVAFVIMKRKGANITTEIIAMFADVQE